MRGERCANVRNRHVRRDCGISSGSTHRRHLRHHRSGQAGFSRHRSRVVQPRPGPARDRRAARRTAARAPGRASPSTIRSTRRSPACGSCASRSPSCTTASIARGMPSQYTAGERVHLRRRPRGADARRGQPRATSTSATSCPTTPPTRSCSTSSRRSPPSRSCSRAIAATPSPPTICGARSSAAACRRSCCRTRAIRRASSSTAKSSSAGWRSRASSTARCSSTSSTRTTSIAAARARCRSSQRGALRGGRRQGSGGALRRVHQELALSRLARHLGGRARGR